MIWVEHVGKGNMMVIVAIPPGRITCIQNVENPADYVETVNKKQENQ